MAGAVGNVIGILREASFSAYGSRLVCWLSGIAGLSHTRK